MSDPPRPDERPTDTLPPGADRFWGQFSQTRAGRSHGDEQSPEPSSEEPREEGSPCLEWCPICRSADLLRSTNPPDPIHQVQAIQHEAVNVLKSFLTVYAERAGEFASESRDSRDDTAATDRGQQRDEPAGRGDDSGRPQVRDISID